MKLRPQVQLRFRDVAQFESLRKVAKGQELSFNEWILRVLEAKDGEGERVGVRGERVQDGVSGRVRRAARKRNPRRDLGRVGRASGKEASRESGAVDRGADPGQPRGKKNDPAGLVAHTLKIAVPNRRDVFGYEPSAVNEKTGAHVIPKGIRDEDILVWLADTADQPRRRKRP